MFSNVSYFNHFPCCLALLDAQSACRVSIVCIECLLFVLFFLNIKHWNIEYTSCYIFRWRYSVYIWTVSWVRLALTLTLTLVYLVYSNCFIFLPCCCCCCYFIFLSAFHFRWFVVVFNLSFAVSVGFIIAKKEKKRSPLFVHILWLFLRYAVLLFCFLLLSRIMFFYALPSFASFSLMSMRWAFFCMLIAQLWLVVIRCVVKTGDQKWHKSPFS